MISKPIALLLATVLFAVAAYAGEQGHQKIEIKVISVDDDGETELTLDGDDLGFSLSEMQVGENRSVVDKEGRPILITRNEDGYSFDVDGKTIDMPLLGDHGGVHEAVDVQVMHEGMVHEGHKAMMAGDGVMIMSAKDIDAATQEIIRNALTAAGHTSVHFETGMNGGPHQIRVVTEAVEIKK